MGGRTDSLNFLDWSGPGSESTSEYSSSIQDRRIVYLGMKKDTAIQPQSTKQNYSSKYSISHRVSHEPLIPHVLAHTRDRKGPSRLHDAASIVEAHLDRLTDLIRCHGEHAIHVPFGDPERLVAGAPDRRSVREQTDLPPFMHLEINNSTCYFASVSIFGSSVYNEVHHSHTRTPLPFLLRNRVIYGYRFFQRGGCCVCVYLRFNGLILQIST